MTRKYETTHPWLTFRADLTRAPIEFWLLLGEARSKCEHIAGVPLRPSTAKKLHELYLIKGVLASTAIEGNTLTEQEALRHLEGKLHLPPSKQYLAREVDNLVQACNQILSALQSGKITPLSRELVSAYNRQVLEGLPGSDDVQPGVLRGHSVTVGSYRGPPSEDCAYLLDHLCEWLTGPDFEPRKELGLASDLLRALLAHLYLAWIHPFGDGNGRTARLLEFHLLVSAGVPSPAAHLFSNHYNQTRAEYYRQLDRASRSGGDVVPFLLYGLQGLVDGLRQQLDLIRHQQVDVAWRNYVHEHFGPTASPTIVRRRNVVLDLSRREQPVPLSEIRDLSPRVATAYAQKTTKTLSRDLRYLVDAGLIALEPKGYRARRELILAFLPARVAGA